jgi:hypothetical protein
VRDGNRGGYGNGSEFPFHEARPRSNGNNGAHVEGMRTRSVSMDEVGEPIDLVAVQADDELINALSAGMSVSAPGLHGYDADDQVAAILAAWKAEVDAEPIPELVDLDTAVATIVAARPPSRRARHLAPVAAAAAFIVLAVGGVSVGSYNSEPGDALWGVSKVLYSERAGSVEAAARVESRIATAKQALAQGDPAVAAQALAQAQAELASVRPEEGKADLADVQNFLAAKADETPPGQPTDPGAPLKKDRSRKVPHGAAIDPKQDPSPATQAPGSESSTPEDPTSPRTVDPRLRQAPPAEGPSSGTTTTAPAPTGNPPPVGTPPATTEGTPDNTSPTAPGQSMGNTEGAPSSSSTTAAGDGPTPATS